jgi:hypothetical protein
MLLMEFVTHMAARAARRLGAAAAPEMRVAAMTENFISVVVGVN